MYWNKTVECMDRELLKELQLKRLKDTVKRVYHNVPYYREKMQKAGLTPEDINALEDIKLLPFTTKDDLRQTYPFGMFAVPLSEVVRIHASSGTTGKPTVVGYTRKDIDTWSELVARAIVSAGGGRDSIVQVSYGYGLFTGGLGLHYGAEKVGAVVVPMSGGNTRRQIMFMKDFGTTILACTPSYALYLAETMEEEGIKPEDLKLKAGIFGAEPWSENMRKEIEQKLHIIALDIYGMSELIGPGVAMECQCKNGLHIYEDCFIAEVIDPVTGEVLPEGQKGELVITSIAKEALPVIRYRTRDITALNSEKCPCGRTHARIDKILGRSDDMLIIRGVNVFPSQIETALLNVGEVEPHYMLVVDRVDNLDQLEVWVEVSDRFFSDEVKGLEDLRKKIAHEIYCTVGINVSVKLVEPKTIERSEGKARRVIDRRKI
ncbi:phenylacetate--CoA ligase family protein [Caldanaerobius polysaccharolyticus]|uniref:phenylacetate--CoA ligase family protein n=1 Tax=Caldanaerobius polysaccharolyticus TaxID=44256 RepID=UPI00047AECB5|nr:phenylacetate--CoA ligase [Caldanaerobius polysaccharolyticus]